MRATLGTAGIGILKVKKAAAITAAAVIVGIGMLALPFLIQANDEEKTNKSPKVSCLWGSESRIDWIRCGIRRHGSS